MKKILRSTAALLVIVTLGLGLTDTLRAAGPPIITQVDAQVTVLSDGMLDIKYRLTFHETESRSGITTMGPFDAGHQMLDSHVEQDGRETPVTLNDKGGNFYGVDLGFNTQPGLDYTVQIHYRVAYALDETTADGASYRVLAWAPIQWNLEIGEQIVTFILPIELPADVTEPEQVTDELVDQAGILVDDSVVASFDRWVYYPTPDETSGQNWLSIYISKANLPPQASFQPTVYLPTRYFSGPVKPEPTPAGAIPPPQET
ncbi:MAG TPA: DUF2207 domain-containing protein, partial [Chloroflexi bacterium]|nr:DUF2207 domain-containing protein [Chloroflexota bacterium]